MSNVLTILSVIGGAFGANALCQFGSSPITRIIFAGFGGLIGGIIVTVVYLTICHLWSKLK